MSLSYHGHSFYTPSSFLLTHIFPILMNKILITLLAQTVKKLVLFCLERGQETLSSPFYSSTIQICLLCKAKLLKFISH